MTEEQAAILQPTPELGKKLDKRHWDELSHLWKEFDVLAGLANKSKSNLTKAVSQIGPEYWEGESDFEINFTTGIISPKKEKEPSS